jgi:hypothetical protein
MGETWLADADAIELARAEVCAPAYSTESDVQVFLCGN